MAAAAGIENCLDAGIIIYSVAQKIQKMRELEALLPSRSHLPIKNVEVITVAEDETNAVLLPHRPSDVEGAAVALLPSLSNVPDAYPVAEAEQAKATSERDEANAVLSFAPSEITSTGSTECLACSKKVIVKREPLESIVDADMYRQEFLLAMNSYESLRLEFAAGNAGGRTVEGQDEKSSFRRPDCRAATWMKQREQCINQERLVGSVPGALVGDTFSSRAALGVLGLHMLGRAGIDSKRDSLLGIPIATSVVIGCDEGYGDNKDYGERVIYSGQGGIPTGGIKDGGMVTDQQLTRGNLALENSRKNNTLVRVIRGYKSKNVAVPLSFSSVVYSYDGLYKVTSSVYEKGVAGNMVYKFMLVRIKNQEPLKLLSPCLSLPLKTPSSPSIPSLLHASPAPLQTFLPSSAISPTPLPLTKKKKILEMPAMEFMHSATTLPLPTEMLYPGDSQSTTRKVRNYTSLSDLAAAGRK